MIPPASIHMPTPTLWVFLIAFVLWFGMLFIGGVSYKIMALAFISGLAYVLTFIDGVAPISKFQTTYQRKQTAKTLPTQEKMDKEANEYVHMTIRPVLQLSL